MTDYAREFTDTTEQLVEDPDEGAPVEWVEEWAPPAPVSLDPTDRTAGTRRRASPVWVPTTTTVEAGARVELLRYDADRARLLLSAETGGVVVFAGAESDLRGAGRFPIPVRTGAPLVLDGWTGALWLENTDASAVDVHVLALSFPNAVPLLS